RYWAIFEELRTELGYADYLGALQRYRVEHPRDPHVLTVSAFMVDYPFANRLYPNSLDVLERFHGWGPTVILSDGDAVFQPRKIERSGLQDIVDGNVLIYIHKERELDDVERRYPADHYVLVDDKPRILTAVKRVWERRVTTVFPRQGHYAHDPQALATNPPADLTVERVGDLLAYDLPALLAAEAPAIHRTTTRRDDRSRPRREAHRAVRRPGLLRGHGRSRLQEDLPIAPGDGEARAPRRPGHRRGEVGVDPRAAQGPGEGQSRNARRTRPGGLREAVRLAALCRWRLRGPGDVPDHSHRARRRAAAGALSRHPARAVRAGRGSTGQGGLCPRRPRDHRKTHRD